MNKRTIQDLDMLGVNFIGFILKENGDGPWFMDPLVANHLNRKNQSATPLYLEK